MTYEMFYTEEEHIPVFKIIRPDNHMEPLIECRYKTSKIERTERIPANQFILRLMQVLQGERKQL